MSDTNAKVEFLQEVEDCKRAVKAAFVTFGHWREDKAEKKLFLKVGYTDEEYEAFLESLNFATTQGLVVKNCMVQSGMSEEHGAVVESMMVANGGSTIAALRFPKNF